MIGCDWLNTPEELRLQSADDGLCVSTVDYRVSLWFHLFHIHEPNGRCCIIHEQIRRSKTPVWTRRCSALRRMRSEAKKKKRKWSQHFKIWTSFVFIHSIKLSLCQWPQCGNETLHRVLWVLVSWEQSRSLGSRIEAKSSSFSARKRNISCIPYKRLRAECL